MTHVSKSGRGDPAKPATRWHELMNMIKGTKDRNKRIDNAKRQRVDDPAPAPAPAAPLLVAPTVPPPFLIASDSEDVASYVMEYMSHYCALIERCHDKYEHQINKKHLIGEGREASVYMIDNSERVLKMLSIGLDHYARGNPELYTSLQENREAYAKHVTLTWENEDMAREVLNSYNEMTIKTVRLEIDIMLSCFPERLRHVSLYSQSMPVERYITKNTSTPKYRAYGIVMQNMGVPLQKIINRQVLIDIECLLFICASILSQLKQLAKAGYIHGDLKADNVLISDCVPTVYSTVSLIDFGVTRLANSSGVPPSNVYSSHLPADTSYSASYDMHSFGILLDMMRNNMLERSQKAEWKTRIDDVVKKCKCVQKERASVDDVIQIISNLRWWYIPIPL